MSQNFLKHNLDIIKKRWPSTYSALIIEGEGKLDVEVEENTLVINQIQLTSNINRVAEAKVQLSRIPENASKVFIYGPALGDTITEALKLKSLELLHVIILNKSVFLLSLQVLNQQDWLEDTRVHLHYQGRIKEVYQPFLVNPAELVLAEQECAQLRDRLSLELNHDFIQQEHDNNLFYQQQLMKNLDFASQDDDISAIPAPKKNDIYIAAAGPTLEDHLPWLSQHKPYIIAVDAALKPLLAFNIIPDIIVSIDPRSFMLFKKEYLNQLANTSLVYFPNVERAVLENWPGKRFCSYSLTKMYNEISHKINKTPLFCAGCVIHPAIDLAIKLQAKNIFLLGADFSFTHNKSHATASKTDKGIHTLNEAHHWLLNSLGEKVPTMANYKGYMRDLERFIATKPEVNFINGSELGATIEGTTLWKKQ